MFGIQRNAPCKWAASWQNQQNDCAPSEDSDQPGHSPSLIRVFPVRMKKAWVLSYPLISQQRLWSDCGCPGWSESSLGAQSFCWFCHEAAQISELCCIKRDSFTKKLYEILIPKRWPCYVQNCVIKRRDIKGLPSIFEIGAIGLKDWQWEGSEYFMFDCQFRTN